MTDRETKIRQNVDKTLAAFDQPQRVTPDPWFQQRVMAKIQAGPSTSPSPWSLFCLQLLKPALLIAIVVLNISFVILAYQQNSQAVRADYLGQLVSDYGYANMEDMFTVDQQRN